mmetsp:Transcript_38940/g.121992  ORF Transcript_38940/g.121992 Transcript_38940/m.121992 type:complete len:233 (-) Transcript_38940:518-1216(-)
MRGEPAAARGEPVAVRGEPATLRRQQAAGDLGGAAGSAVGVLPGAEAAREDLPRRAPEELRQHGRRGGRGGRESAVGAPRGELLRLAAVLPPGWRDRASALGACVRVDYRDLPVARVAHRGAGRRGVAPRRRPRRRQGHRLRPLPARRGVHLAAAHELGEGSRDRGLRDAAARQRPGLRARRRRRRRRPGARCRRAGAKRPQRAAHVGDDPEERKRQFRGERSALALNPTTT